MAPVVPGFQCAFEQPKEAVVAKSESTSSLSQKVKFSVRCLLVHDLRATSHLRPSFRQATRLLACRKSAERHKKSSSPSPISLTTTTCVSVSRPRPSGGVMVEILTVRPPWNSFSYVERFGRQVAENNFGSFRQPELTLHGV